MEKPRKKLFFESEDDVSLVVKKLSQSKDPEVVLNLPKDSSLYSLDHFQFVRQKAEEQGKRVFVESVDDHVLELSELAGLEAVNPVFRTRGRPVADIVPIKINRPTTKKVDGLRDESDEDSDDLDKEIKKPKGSIFAEVAHRTIKRESAKRDPLQMILRYSFLAAVLGAVYWVGFLILPKATVVLGLKGYPVSFADKVKVSVEAPAVVLGENEIVLPGEILKSVKNLEMSFPAEKREDIKRKAEGQLTIFNAYSSEPQPLVAQTRFQTPEGKIFRLKEKVVVPGAEVTEGKIKPASIDVTVVADEPGPLYNIGPVEKLTIPGFQDTPKFDGFYGKTTGDMKGGLIGFQAVPSEEELAKAKKQVKDALLDVLKNETTVLMSESFEVLDGTTAFEIKREDVYPTIGSDDHFSVFMEAELKQLVFDKEMLAKALGDKNQSLAETDFETRVRDIVFDYEDAVADVTSGRVSFVAKGSVVFEADVKASGLTAEILGKSNSEARTELYKLPGLDKANVDLWPFWVTRVPKDEKKVNVKFGE